MIRPPRADEVAAVAALVATQQAHRTTRDAFFGDTPDEVAALLAAWETPWAETAYVCERQSRIVGFIGAELDDSLSRVWIHGPLVVDPDWDEVADELLAALETGVASLVRKDQELAGDVANERIASFSARHGFAAGKVHDVLSLTASGIARLLAPALPPILAEHEEAFLALHDEVFPGTYYSGRQLLDLAARDEVLVLGLVDDDQLAGYAAGRIDEGGTGYIDFVGVATSLRRQGHGTTLVAAMCHALATRAPIEKVALTVSSENAAALALYDALGFVRTSSAVGYRRRPEPRI